jgi:hypothetical protein
MTHRVKLYGSKEGGLICQIPKVTLFRFSLHESDFKNARMRKHVQIDYGLSTFVL